MNIVVRCPVSPFVSNVFQRFTFLFVSSTNVLRFCLSALQVVVVFSMFVFVLFVLLYVPQLRLRNHNYTCVRLKCMALLVSECRRSFSMCSNVVCFCSSALQVSIVFRYVCFRLCFPKLNFATKPYFMKVTSKQVNRAVLVPFSVFGISEKAPFGPPFPPDMSKKVTRRSSRNRP